MSILILVRGFAIPSLKNMPDGNPSQNNLVVIPYCNIPFIFSIQISQYIQVDFNHSLII